MDELLIFLEALKKGERDVLKLLELTEDILEELPFENLFAHEEDMLHGLNRMQRCFNSYHFDLFDKILVKHFDNGKIEIGLYTQTTDTEEIIPFSKFLLDRFQDEITKYTKEPSFCNHKMINDFANGTAPADVREMADKWSADDIFFSLFYVNAPVNVFGWIISVEPDKTTDRSVRANGTILNLLDFDIHLLLAIGDSYQPEEVDPENGQFVDYTYWLDKKQLGLFDVLRIRIFDRQRVFRTDVCTHIFLSSSEPVSFDDMTMLVDKLYDLYGSDDSGDAESEYSEREVFDMLGGFFGRRWTFNHTHGLWDNEIEAEEIAYVVEVNNVNNQGEFRLTIRNYNDLVSLFG